MTCMHGAASSVWGTPNRRGSFKSRSPKRARFSSEVHYRLVEQGRAHRLGRRARPFFVRKILCAKTGLLLPATSYHGGTPQPLPHDPNKFVPNHFDDAGNAHMVDVSEKSVTTRVAVASGTIEMLAQTAELILSAKASKGDVLGVARLAGIGATKWTHHLIPLCHAIPIESGFH